MRTLRGLVLLFVLTAGAGAGATPFSRVLLIGDSITAGVVSGGGGTPYATLLGSLLGDGYDVVNAGCGGASSLDWTLSSGSPICGGVGLLDASLFEARAAPYLPSDVVTLMLGTNDAVGFFEPTPVPVASYAAALGEIVANLLAAGAPRVILMTPPDHEWSQSEARIRLLGYRDAILSLCGATGGVRCGPDVFTLLDPALDFARGDVHPNARGHERIAQALRVSVLTNPEPATGLLVGLGLAGLARRRRRAVG